MNFITETLEEILKNKVKNVLLFGLDYLLDITNDKLFPTIKLDEDFVKTNCEPVFYIKNIHSDKESDIDCVYKVKDKNIYILELLIHLNTLKQKIRDFRLQLI